MTVNTAASTTYGMVGIREDLSDMIYDISPTETPVTTAMKRGEKATQRKKEWQKDALAAAAVNTHIEGDDAVYRTASATVRLHNQCQTFTKAIIVSDIANAVTTAGRKEEMAYQLAKRSKEIKRDIEFTVCGNYASLAGSTASASTLGSIEAWLETNVSRGSGGASGGFTSTTGPVEAATDASSTNQRTFTEARLKPVLRSCWDNGGDPTIVVVGSFNKTQASAFAGIATKYQDLNPGGGKRDSANVAILGAADVYVHDFGVVRIVPNRFSRARTALVLDMDYWELNDLQPYHTLNLARTGTAERKMLVRTLTLTSKNEAASGVVADLTTS